MQDLLSMMDPQEDPNAHVEFKERILILCARFLGGAWKTVSFDDFKVCRIKGGMSNMLFLCRLTENHPPCGNEPDKVLLRVYFNPETETHLVAESVIFTLLSERHLGPKLYGIFSGGRLEEYIPSRPLKTSEISLKTMSSKIARRIAKIHQLEVPIWKEPVYICDALERWLLQLRMKMPDEGTQFRLPKYYEEFGVPSIISLNDLENEVKNLRILLAKSKSPVVFCHNDLQEGNILLPKASSGNIRLQSDDSPDGSCGNSLSAFNPTDPKLVLIDFEYASYNYRGFDFANHFVEYSISYDVDHPPYYSLLPECFPSHEHMKDFMINYLKGAGLVLSEEILSKKSEEMIKETLPFIPVSHIFWGVWGLLQVELSPVEFGFSEYGRERLGLYYKNKPLFDHLNNESRVTFISGQSMSTTGSEKNSTIYAEEVISQRQNNSSTSPSASRPTPSIAAESDPSKIILPAHLDTVSLVTPTPSNQSERSTTVTESRRSIESSAKSSEVASVQSDVNGDDNVFPEKVDENNKDFRLPHITPRPRKQIRDGGHARKTTIIEDNTVEDMLHKDISSLKIPIDFKQKIPFNIGNFVNDGSVLSPQLTLFDAQKHFNMRHIPELPQKSTAVRMAKISDDGPLTTSTPLINSKLDISDFLFGGGAKIPQDMVNSLKVVIDELQYAKQKLKTVQKSYFDQQVKSMEEGWNQLDEANREFQALKSEEFAKIAEIRSKLSDEIKKKSAKEDAKRIKELEDEIQKQKDEEVKRNRVLSELRVKFNNAEASLKAYKDESNKRLNQIVEMQSTIAKAQVENSNLRVKLNLVKEKEKEALENSKTDSTAKRSTSNSSVFQNGRSNVSLLQRSNYNPRHDSVPEYINPEIAKPRSALARRSVRWSTPLATSQSFTNLSDLTSTFTFPGPSKRNVIAGMMNTKYEMTERGNEYTFTNGPSSVICTELKCHCRLYEWNNDDFTWTFRLLRQRVEVNFYSTNRSFEVWTPRGNRFLFFIDKQFEIHWRNGDRTLVMPNGKRIEMYLPEELVDKNTESNDVVQFEMFEDIGCIKWSTVEDPQEFFPDDKREGKRGQDLYTSIIDSFSYSVNCNDFKLRRLNSDGYTKLVFPSISLQLNICIADSIFVAKHIVQTGNNEKEKRDCFSSGSCSHITRN